VVDALDTGSKLPIERIEEDLEDERVMVQNSKVLAFAHFEPVVDELTCGDMQDEPTAQLVLPQERAGRARRPCRRVTRGSRRGPRYPPI